METAIAGFLTSGWKWTAVFASLGSQFDPVFFGVRPGAHLFDCATTRAMDVLYPQVTGKPWGVPDPAFGTQAGGLGRITAFVTETAPDISRHG